MSSSEKREQLARKIDSWVKDTIAAGGGDETLLESMHEYMPAFSEIMDISSPSEMTALAKRYDGFFRFATLLEHLATDIEEGRISIPEPKS